MREVLRIFLRIQAEHKKISQKIIDIINDYVELINTKNEKAF